MDAWVVIAERFGIPLMLLFGAVYGIVRLFNWMANDMMGQIKEEVQEILEVI